MPTNSKPNYSEFSVTIDHSLTVALRLIVDSYSYFLYTSDAKDNACLARLEEALRLKMPDATQLEIGAKAIEIAAVEADRYGSVSEFRRNISIITEVQV
jgi:hypothetical protein